jgi:hypothetical protein
VRVVELRLAEPTGPGFWGVDEAVLQAVDRVLVELDVPEHARRRTQDHRVLAKAHPQALFRAIQQGLRAGAGEFGHARNPASHGPDEHPREPQAGTGG